MDNTLKRLANDPHTVTDLKEFMTAVIKEEAGEMAYRGDDTVHVKTAARMVERTFERLEELYKIKEHEQQPINEAR